MYTASPTILHIIRRASHSTRGTRNVLLLLLSVAYNHIIEVQHGWILDRVYSVIYNLVIVDFIIFFFFFRA